MRAPGDAIARREAELSGRRGAWSGAASNGSTIFKPKWKRNCARRWSRRWRTPSNCSRPICAVFGRNSRTRSKRSSLPREKIGCGKTIPDFARQRRELLQSIELTLVERVAGKAVEEQLARMFRETAAWLRLPAGVAAAGGIITVIVAMSSASVADVTGTLAVSAAVIGTIVAFTQRRKILAAYETEMDKKREELVHAIEQQMKHAIDLFYKEIAVAFEPLAAFCIAERKRYEPLLEQAEGLTDSLGGLGRRLGVTADLVGTPVRVISGRAESHPYLKSTLSSSCPSLPGRRAARPGAWR